MLRSLPSFSSGGGTVSGLVVMLFFTVSVSRMLPHLWMHDANLHNKKDHAINGMIQHVHDDVQHMG
jgi:hypothetical protein